MYFLDEAVDLTCLDSTLDPVWNIIGIVVNIIMIGVPILLIILGMIDFAKAVVTNKEENSKKAAKAFGMRVIYAVAVFLVVWIITAVFSLVSEVFGDSDDYKYNENSWKVCWCKIRSSDDQKCIEDYKNTGGSCYTCLTNSGYKNRWYSDSSEVNKTCTKNNIKTKSECET